MDAIYTGKKISSLRKEKNFTQKDLAEKLHVSDKAVSKWERGLNYPDLTLLPVIANVLETSVTELLGLENSISDSAIEVINEIALSEKKQIIKIIQDYLLLTIILSVVVILNTIYAYHIGYTWKIVNIQFWINGILIALALTLITNGIRLLIKGKKLSL